jgi:hypothetical protein
VARSLHERTRHDGVDSSSPQAPEPTLGDSFLDLDADDGWARDMAASLALMPPAEARGTVLKGVCAASGDSGGSGTTRGGDSLTLTNSRGDLGGCGDEDGCAIRPHGKKHILGHSEMTPLASLRYLSPDSVMPGHQAVTGGPFPFFTLRGGLRVRPRRGISPLKTTSDKADWTAFASL